jgi:hypothetical protein
LSSQSLTCGTRAAKGSRWKPARGLCGQHPQLSPLAGCHDQCQWNGSATTKPRQVSVRLASARRRFCTSAASRDWSRRAHRRACMQLVRHQRIEVNLPPPAASPRKGEVIFSRAQRAHARLSWAERLARNARVPTASQVTIRLFGVPEGFATSLGLATV